MNPPRPSVFEEIQKEYLHKVDSYIEDYWTTYLNKKDRGSYCVDMAKYHLATGGKRIRALIPLFIFKIFNQDPARALPLGAAVELIHNATLIHDDIQDGDQVRRGQPTVWKKYSIPQAINSGDALFFFSLQVLEKLDAGAIAKQAISSLAIQSTLDVIEGQTQEFLMKAEECPSTRRYLQVISGKTSGLFRLPILAALTALGCDADLLKAAERAADDLGMLFQIQDDFLDIYGNKNRDQPATDIAEGKISFLVAHVNDHGSQSDRRRLDQILKTARTDTTREQIEEALKILEKYQARETALTYMTTIRDELFKSTAISTYPEIKQITLELSLLFLSLI